MGAPAASPDLDLDKLRLVMEASLRVRQRHHFFNWAQGPLQTLLPHDMLICCAFDQRSRACRVDHFSCYPPSENDFARTGAASEDAIRQLLRAWDGNDRRPLLLDAPVPAEGATVSVTATAHRQLGHGLAHGTSGLDGAGETFFVICRMPCAANALRLYMAELLVPHLHAAWTRVLRNAGKGRGEAAPAARDHRGMLTSRETEILRWMYEGKSNIEIGAILGISRLTVKNHVQSILRKLNVHNRAQAVGKGLRLDLLPGSPSVRLF